MSNVIPMEKKPLQTCTTNSALASTAFLNPDAPSLPEEWVRRIFFRFEQIYHDAWLHRFKAANEHDTKNKFRLAILEWGQTLHDLTAEEIAKGIATCKTTHVKFPPTNPYEFRELCRPEEKLPDFEEMLSAAYRRDFDFHPALISLYKKCGGSFTWKNESDKFLRQKFRGFYDALAKNPELIKNCTKKTHADSKAIDNLFDDDKNIALLADYFDAKVVKITPNDDLNAIHGQELEPEKPKTEKEAEVCSKNEQKETVAEYHVRLLNTSEKDAMFLTVEERYDRCRLISQDYGMAMVRRHAIQRTYSEQTGAKI